MIRALKLEHGRARCQRGMILGNVVAFAVPVRKPEAGAGPRILNELRSTIVADAREIGCHRMNIEKNLRAIEQIMLSTDNPEIRARLLHQLKTIHDQLVLVSLKLITTKQSIQESVGVRD